MYIYQYRYVLTNSVGDNQVVLSPEYTNPYKMAVALLQSYRFLEQRLIGDLALVRRRTTDILLDLIKLRIAIGRAREIITKICEEPEFPGQIREGFPVLEFTPEPGSVPLRSAIMEVMVMHASEYHQTQLVSSTNMCASQQTHFTPVEYKFINRYLRTMPKFPMS